MPEDVRALSIFFAALFVSPILLLPAGAEAFCGFYVNDSSGSLTNDATMVSLLREGKQTVLTMRNSYEGPPEDFAMVVPVPEVIDKEQVKTVDPEVFERLDDQTSPRLVEYWQKDPCERKHYHPQVVPQRPTVSGPGGKPVRVASKFTAGEYEIVVLEADESNALEGWLTDRGYNIPDGAAKYFQPYVADGTYFFVAKVDVDEVDFENTNGGKRRAVLSPLRFQYDSDDFRLPIRLGLINSAGQQDLVAIILSRDGRYEVANYPNATIPTNLTVDTSVKGQFGSFYDALLDRTIRKNSGAVVTEYAWEAGTCDPCPETPMSADDLAALGADVTLDFDTSAWEALPPEWRRRKHLVAFEEGADLDREGTKETVKNRVGVLHACVQRRGAKKGFDLQPGQIAVRVSIDDAGDAHDPRVLEDSIGGRVGRCVAYSLGNADFPGTEQEGRRAGIVVRYFMPPRLLEMLQGVVERQWTVTRLHARWGPETVGADLVFEQAEPIRGGRGGLHGEDGTFRHQGSRPSGRNNFQARYAIRHEWTEPLSCEVPYSTRWGGPPDGTDRTREFGAGTMSGGQSGPVKLEEVVHADAIPYVDGEE